ncbi:MAG: precorrin-8X methylmutase, partial [Lachnospiraceae bacterium]|nr:precorrin-8X methylmutase [Lachnospiraceae bacterium]
AETLFFTEDVITNAHKAIRGGKTIITDTNMALAGVSKPACRKWSCQSVCYMAEPEIARKAKEEGTTRAYAAMIQAAERFPDGIYVIGNAPTALLCLDRLIRAGSCRPSLVIGVPVGFVNVVESKELLRETCLRYRIPAIFNMGQKGGSGVAAAVMNALLYTAGAD